MSTASLFVPAPVEPRWLTYAKSALFLVPPALLWLFAQFMIFPKLQQIWLDAGLEPTSHGAWMSTLAWSVRNAYAVFGAVLLGLLLLELCSTAWQRHRRVGVGLVLFLLNSAIAVGLTAMCISALLAAPALMHHK